MTAEPLLPPITCPSSLVASCAPLLGFVPADCVVAFIQGVPGRRSPVIMRVDLPPVGGATSFAADIAPRIARTGGCAIDVVAWVADEDSASRHELTSTPFLVALEDALGLGGIEVGASLSTNGRVWWSHSCSDPVCCPEASTALEPATMDAVRAEYAFAGYAPLASREKLGDRVARDELRAGRVGRAMSGARPARPTLRWCDAQIRFLTELLMPTDACDSRAAPLSTAKAARLLRGLSDTRVRDVLLHRLVVRGRHCQGCWAGTIETLCDALRCAPLGAAAPAATILALVAWMVGEGSLATICVQRALEEDPGHRLAAMASQLMGQGTDPRLWRESLTGLSEAECRSPGRR